MQNEKAKTYRWWFLTYNNPPAEWTTIFKDFGASYSVGQLERGEKGTLHVQGLLYYPTGQRASRFKGMPVWIQGISRDDALLRVTSYVTKTDTRVEGPYEEGTKPANMSRGRDWELCRTLAKEGRFEEIPANLYIPYHANIHKIHLESGKATTSDNIRGLWIYGKPGQGKSHYARDKFGDDLYIKPQNKWWDGYVGQESVLMDDFDSSCFGHYLKIWADKWACSGEIKGGTIPLQHKVFIITSNYLPEDLWPDSPQDQSTLREAIKRRFIFIIFTGNRQYTIGEEPGQYPPSYLSNLNE